MKPPLLHLVALLVRRAPLAAAHLAEPPAPLRARPRLVRAAAHAAGGAALETLEDRWTPNDPLGIMQAP